MHGKQRFIIIPVLLIVALLVTAWWYLGREATQAAVGGLSASGTIEAVQVQIAPEVAGLVVEVLADEGQPVSRMDILVRIDDTLLQAQLDQALASLSLAEANYAVVVAGVPPEQRQLGIAQAQLELTNAEQALEKLYDQADLVAAQAGQAVAQADKVRDLAQQKLDNMTSAADPADIDAAWAAVVLARDKLDNAKEDFEPYEKKSEDNLTRAMLQSQVAAAQKQYDAVVTRYNNLVGTSNEYDLALAQAEVSLAQAQLAENRRQYTEVKSRPDPDALAIAQDRLAVAQASLAAAQADPSPEQLTAAQAQVEVVQRAVETLQAQLASFTLHAPMDGVVLVRAVEPGEMVLPGASLITLARLDSLRITVYIPEDRYGEIQLGEQASVEVDSFPGQRFTARVVRIADQAEFTPRNVQTEEGRKTTVFAVELVVDNPGNQLKPGMPADVTFK